MQELLIGVVVGGFSGRQEEIDKGDVVSVLNHFALHDVGLSSGQGLALKNSSVSRR
jgi:hypothetical protein